MSRDFLYTAWTGRSVSGNLIRQPAGAPVAVPLLLKNPRPLFGVSASKEVGAVPECRRRTGATPSGLWHHRGRSNADSPDG
jgi:hypothetical protein